MSTSKNHWKTHHSSRMSCNNPMKPCKALGEYKHTGDWDKVTCGTCLKAHRHEEKVAKEKHRLEYEFLHAKEVPDRIDRDKYYACAVFGEQRVVRGDCLIDGWDRIALVLCRYGIPVSWTFT